MTHLKAAELEHLTDQNILRQSLAVGSVVLTASSFARSRAQRAAFRLEFEEEMRQIGEGLQGAIFEQLGLSVVLKKEAPGNESRPSSLQHEYKIHAKVHRAFRQYDGQIGSHISVPRPFGIILTVQEQFWNDHLQRFPATYRLRTNVVEMERILPLPKVIRKSLIRQFYPRPDGQDSIDPAVLDEILSDPTNKDCLVRPYLGQSEGQYNAEAFSLRNFPLYLKDMEKLGLGVKDMARCMGKAYATIHWGAGADSDDVEFVLGSAVISDSESSHLQHRETGLYLLDFGQCVSVDLAQPPHVVYQAFKGAMVTGDNQKFIPHYSRTPELFREFRKGYMESGQIILKEKDLDHQFDMKDFMDEYEEYAEDFLY